MLSDVIDSSLLNASRTSYHALPMSPLTEVLHGSSDVRVSPVVNPARFDISTRHVAGWNEDILC